MKKKLTPKQRALKEDWERVLAKHAGNLERGAKAKSVVVTKSASKRQTVNSVVVDPNRLHKHMPSLDTGYSSTAKKADKVYTGDALVGISQMHKSNPVPVFNLEAVRDINKMRRG